MTNNNRRATRELAKRRILAHVAANCSPGEKLTPIRTLAQQLGVANGTVYQAVSELVADGVFEARPRSGIYIRKPLSSLTATRQTSAAASLTISVYFILANRFVAPIYEGLSSRMLQLGVSVNPVILLPEYVQTINIPQTTTLAVILNPSPRWTIKSAAARGHVIVTTADELPNIDSKPLDVVSIDQEQGGLTAGQALKRAGCTSGFYVGVESSPKRFRTTCLRRLAGFEAGMGITLPEHHLSYQPYYGAPAGIQAAREYFSLKHQPEAVFCASDELAIGFAAYAGAIGCKPGKNFHLIGFDGQARGQELLPGPLTTVQVPCHALGQQAADIAFDRATDITTKPNRKLLLSCQLLQGTTLTMPDEQSDHPPAKANPA